MISRGFFYLNWASKFYIEEKPYLTSKKDVFLQGLRDTLNIFGKKKIIFVLENPTMNFMPPERCAVNRQLSLGLNDSVCGVSRSYDDEMHSDYIDSVKLVLSEYPNVSIFDPRQVFCDKFYCYAGKDSVIWYSDYNHLSDQGSFIQGEAISNLPLFRRK